MKYNIGAGGRPHEYGSTSPERPLSGQREIPRLRLDLEKVSSTENDYLPINRLKRTNEIEEDPQSHNSGRNGQMNSLKGVDRLQSRQMG